MSQGKGSRRTPPPKWSMYPSLHDAVSQLLEGNNLDFEFHDIDNNTGTTRTYDTSIMGRFTCVNQNCQTKSWSSKRIAITIRKYHNERYNARVYHQRCKACSWLSKPKLDDSYAERVAYRLQKWSGVEVERPTFSGTSKGPHEKELCEGCKAGHCNQSRGVDELADELGSFGF